MKVLLLGNEKNFSEITLFFKKKKIEFIIKKDELSFNTLKKFNLIISFGYRHIINEKVLKKLRRPPINLHISYLPYNKGAHPNFWSFIEDTPSGISIHEVDQGIDTGKILYQKKIIFDLKKKPSLTFKDTYRLLNKEISKLFIKNFFNILEESYTAKKQKFLGTYHRTDDLPYFINWNAKIFEFKQFYKRNFLINKNFQIRDKNNVYSIKDVTKIEKKLNKIITHKNLVLFVTDNSAESLKFYIVLLKLNCCLMLIDSKNLNFENINTLIKRFNPNYIFMGNKNNFPNYKLLLRVKNSYLYKSKLNKNLNINDELMLLLPTSGSMGAQKFVKLSYDNVLSNTLSINRYLNINSKDRVILNMSQSYSYGLSIINTHLFSGSEIVCNNNDLFSKEFWKLYKRFPPTNFNGVPSIYEIIQKLKLKNFIQKNLRFLTVAGGSLQIDKNKSFIKKIIDKKINFFSMYGQTEASPRIAYYKILKKNLYQKNFSQFPLGKIVARGKVMLKYYDKDLYELRYKGPNIFVGYLKTKKDLREIKQIKILKTGDLVKVKKDIIYIHSRKSRIGKVYGERHDLNELEKLVSSRNNKAHIIAENDKIYLFSNKKNFHNIKFLPKNVKINTFQIYVKKFPKINGKISYFKLKQLIN